MFIVILYAYIRMNVAMTAVGIVIATTSVTEMFCRNRKRTSPQSRIPCPMFVKTFQMDSLMKFESSFVMMTVNPSGRNSLILSSSFRISALSETMLLFGLAMHSTKIALRP